MKRYKYFSMLVWAMVAVLFNSSPGDGECSEDHFYGNIQFRWDAQCGEWTYLPGGNVLACGIVETYYDVNTDLRVTSERMRSHCVESQPG